MRTAISKVFIYNANASNKVTKLQVLMQAKVSDSLVRKRQKYLSELVFNDVGMFVLISIYIELFISITFLSVVSFASQCSTFFIEILEKP